MDTKLIYVNKGNAVVRNESTGEFISSVPSVEVKAGDAVSIEALAISTTGTGADTIEIPQVVKDYNYITNEVQLEFMIYIHANFRYTCQLPISGCNIYTTINALNYGDMNPGIFVPTSNTDYAPKNAALVEKWGGSRFYLGSWGDNGDNPVNPFSSTTQDDVLNSTGNLVFNFLTTKIPCKVDFGYNTPDNISSKITFDLHNSAFTPNDTIWGRQINYYTPNYTQPGDLQQATCVSENSSVMTIFGLPRQYFNSATGYFSTYNNLIAVHDPWYWYYGTRLGAGAPNGTTKFTTYSTIALGTANVTQADIITLNPFRQTGVPARSTFQDGDILVTNLPYTSDVLLKVKNFLHSQKYYTGTSKTREQMKADIERWQVKILFGKYDDSNPDPYGNSATLQDKVGSATSVSPCWVTTKAYFNEDLFNSANIPVAVPSYPIVISPIDVTLPDGSIVSKKEAARYYNINVIPVQTDPGDSSPSLGIILEQNASTLGNTDELVVPGSYCLFDSTFSREESTAQVIASTDLVGGDSAGKHNLDKMIRGFNVGSPDIQLVFNANRSRFAFSDMYWASYIGHEDDDSQSNPSADQQAISCNRVNTGFYRPLNTEIAYTQYAQSGLGLQNIYIKNKLGTWILVDPKSNDDLKNKWKNSLLERIGFDINDLIDDTGIPYVFYQERYDSNNEPVQYPQLYPYPLTCTPEVDTAFNISINANKNKLPMFNLSLERQITGINIASQSAQILARNKPNKLATPFWLIESDILPATRYYVDGMPHNIMAICNRAYGSGDFVFSFAADYRFIATKPFVISSIKSNILTSDLLPALVDDSTTIVYKVESPIMPNFVSAQQALQLEEEEEEKVKKK